MNSSNTRVKVARRHRRPQAYTELDSDVIGLDCNSFITRYIIYYACICPTFTGIRMTRLMLTYLPCLISCLLLCTMFHVFLYIHYVHICLVKTSPYVLVHAYVYSHVSCSIFCTRHSLCWHHSTSILSQSDPAECGFSIILWTSCSRGYVMGAYWCSRSTMEFCGACAS